MSYDIYGYDSDKLKNKKLLDTLSSKGVRKDDLEIAWRDAFDYIASKGQISTSVKSNPNLVIMGLRSPSGPIKISDDGLMYTVIIKAFGYKVMFRYNSSLRRVSYRYTGS